MKVVVFQCNVFRSRSKFLRRGHSDARLVILVDLTYKRGGLHVDGEDPLTSLRSVIKGITFLQPTDPKNREVCIHDDIAGMREYILSI